MQKINVMRMHLAKLLVREGLVSVDQIREAIERQRELNYGLCESLSDLGFISESSLVEFLGDQYGFPVMDIDAHEIDRDVIRLIPNETARGKYLIPVEVSGSDLTVAISDPSNILLLDDLGFLTGKNIKPVVASERSIKAKLAEYYSSDEAGSGLPAKENVAQSRSRHLSAILSMGDETRRPVDEIINELEQYRDNHISPNDVTRDEKRPAGPQIENGFTHREEDKSTSDELTPGLSDYESGEYPLNMTDGFEGASSLDENPFGESGSIPDFSESRGEIELLESSNNDEENNLESGEYDSGPLLKPESEKEWQTPVAEEATADFDEPVREKDAERVIGFDSKSDKGPIEHELKGSDSFSSEKKKGEKNKDMTNHPIFNLYQVEDASGEADRSASAVTVEKGKEDSAEKRNLQNRAHDFRSSLHREKEVDDGFSESEDSAHEENEMFGPEFNADSFEAGIAKKTDGVSFADEEESNTEGLDYFNTDNAESEEIDQEEANYSSCVEDDSKKEIDVAKIGAQSDIRHEYNDGSFEEEEAVTNSSERIDDDINGKQSRGSVLIVDDSLTVQKIVSIALTREGYTVYTAGDGMQALSRLNEVIPDLIFVDVNMPHMDGYQLCKIIKNHGLTKNIPVVMLTGKTRILDKMKCKRAGARDYIAKPFDSGSLIEAAATYTN